MLFTREYFDSLLPTSTSSARRIFSNLFASCDPRSVVDVGCGTGPWLRVAREMHGIDDILGIDGAHIELSQLEIPRDRFRVHDLSEALRLERRFDLVLSLEVAQYLPSERGAAFVESLAALGDLVLFSSSVPRQNPGEDSDPRWPAEWAELFSSHGFQVSDALRWEVWEAPEVAWWYAQNLLLFARPAAFERWPELASRFTSTDPPKAVIHPRLWLEDEA